MSIQWDRANKQTGIRGTTSLFYEDKRFHVIGKGIAFKASELSDYDIG